MTAAAAAAAAARGANARAKAWWLRCDLRLDDNLALQAACQGAGALLPIYVFDLEKFNVPTLAGARKSSARRARFLLESISCLRRRLEAKGSGLAVFIGRPQDVLPRTCSECDALVVTRGVCSEETREEASVEKKLKNERSACKLNRVWGGTLYMPDECGCAPDNTPLMFTSFKNKAEGRGRIREPVDAPWQLPPLPDDKSRDSLAEALEFLPTLEQLGYSADEADAASQDDPRGVLPFEGGEDAATQRMKKWIWDDDKLREYFEIRNGMLGEGYSSKFSPWLALGCLSPRRVWLEAQRYERERAKNKSTYWLIFELTWRDFFVYMARSQGDKIFLRGGVIGDNTPWHGSVDALNKWKEGRTGDLLVDANMRELAATGFMSNRGRQNVASYLIFDLGVDWRHGAAHFEEHLLDYDPCSNWGNWVAAAGLTGQRVNKFNTRKQLSDYDPKREYVRHWAEDSGRARKSPRPAVLSSPDERTEEQKKQARLERFGVPEPTGSLGKSGSKGYVPSGKGGKSKGRGYEGSSDAGSNYKKSRRWHSSQRVAEEATGA